MVTVHPFNKKLIGASLSEPHTSMTALQTCVCICTCMFVWTDHLPEILNGQIQVFHEDRYREAVEGYCQTCQSAASGTESDDD